MKGKALHQLSLREQAAFLQPIAERVQGENLKKGTYNVSQAGEAKDIMIHDYRDRSEHVRVNAATSNNRTVRRIKK